MMLKDKKKETGKLLKKQIDKKENFLEKQYMNGIKKLEISFDEILDAHKRKILGNISVLKSFPKAVSNKNREKMKEIILKIESIKVKPKKGRAKDLLKIEKFLKEILSIFPEDIS